MLDHVLKYYSHWSHAPIARVWQVSTISINLWLSVLIDRVNSRDAVVLVYQAKQDNTICEVKSLGPEHKTSTRCILRKVFGKKCQLCQEQSTREQEEEKVIETPSSSSSMIENELDSPLLGMLTLSDIINQMSKPRNIFLHQITTESTVVWFSILIRILSMLHTCKYFCIHFPALINYYNSKSYLFWTNFVMFTQIKHNGLMTNILHNILCRAL